MIFNRFPRINRNVIIFVLSSGMYYGSYAVVDAFLSILITSRITGGRLDIVGLVLSYTWILRSFIEIPLSFVTRSFTLRAQKRLIFLGFTVYGITLIALGFATNLWEVFIAQTITAIINAATYPSKWTIFSHALDKGEEGLEWGMEDTVSTTLPAISSAAAGVLATVYGLPVAFLLFGLIMIAAGIGFLFIRPRARVILSDEHQAIVRRHTKEAFLWIVKLLRKHTIPFEISGGFAANVYGSKRPLADIDIDIPERAFGTLLADVHPYIIYGPKRYRDKHWDLFLMTLSYKGQVIDLAGTEHTKIFDYTTKKWVPHVNDFSRHTYQTIFGLRVPIDSIEELIEYKTMLHRRVDTLDVKALQR